MSATELPHRLIGFALLVCAGVSAAQTPVITDADIERARKGQPAVTDQDIEAARLEMEKAERAYDLNKVAELRHGKIPQMEAELKRLEKKGAQQTTLFKEEVSEEEIAEYSAPLKTREGRSALFRYLKDALSVTAMRDFEKTLGALREFPTKLCLVYAERDPMVPPGVGARLRKLLPSAEFHWMNEASHFAHVDAAERFARLVLPFLQS